MPDLMIPLFAAPAPTAERPLSGVTVLLVEDSRYASEAVRLLCLRSGARIRRADSLRNAERHLATYRPNVVMVDVGLPDGSGLDLIARLAAATPRLPAILGTSGDAGMHEAAIEAGADGFVAKPIASLSAFQDVIRRTLKLEGETFEKRPSAAERLVPDPIAYRDDLAVISDLLAQSSDPKDLAYAAQFLSGIAHSADDPALAEASSALAAQLKAGAPTGSHFARVAGLVEDRLHNSERRFA